MAKNRSSKKVRKQEIIDGNNSSKEGNHHNTFIRSITQRVSGVSLRFRKRRFKRSIGIEATPDMNHVVAQNEIFLEPGLKLHPEACAFLFRINGCSKNLFLFLVLKKLDFATGQYFFNHNVINEFQEFVTDFFGIHYTSSTIGQAHRNLVKANITCNLKTGLYFMNPLVAGGRHTDGRRGLVNAYTKLLSSKPSKSAEDIYPIYKTGNE